MSEITVIEMTNTELDTLIRETYEITEHDYSFVVNEDGSEGSRHTFNVSSHKALDELEEYNQEYTEQAEKGILAKHSTRVVLQDLVNIGVLKPADYIVTVVG